MKSLNGYIFIAMITLVSYGTARGDSTGIVTFTIDDLSSGVFEIAFPIFEVHDIRGSLFGNAERFTGDQADYYVSSVREIIAAGWEFGAHGFEHTDLRESDPILLERELGATAALIYKLTGVYPTTLSTPYGRYNDHVIERAARYYDAHVRAWGERGFNNFDSTDHFRINRSRVGSDRYDSPQAVCEEIEKAGREGQWLVLLFHYFERQESPEEEEDKYVITTEWLQEIVGCANELRNQGIIRVLTVKEALEHIPHSPR